MTLDRHLDALHLPPDASLAQALRATLDACLHQTHVTLPHIEGVPAQVLCRWLHRVCLEARPWCPLMWIDTAHLEGEETAPWLPTEPLWLHVSGEPHAGLEVARERARARSLTWLEEGQERHEPPDHVRAAMLAMDAWYDVATDPGLARARRAVLAHARAGSTVHIVGEQHTGKLALIGWAHATLEGGPLRLMRQEPHVPQGGWRVFEDVATLTPELGRALSEALTSPQRVVWQSWGRAGRRPERGLEAFDAIAAQAASMIELFERAARVAKTPLPILILGESGVGKELLARAIHASSERAGPFVALNVGTLSEEMAASALFGHVKGAFTGAREARRGAFRSAQSGTLFLDEIGDLSPGVQRMLLRALQEKQVRPLGADAPVACDVRLLTATHRDLERMSRQGSFRLDLWMRLNAATLRVPPLRDRMTDLEILAQALLERMGHTSDALWCTPEALEVLRRHRWPGNVRELENVLAYAIAMLEPGAPRIDVHHLGELARGEDAPLFTTGRAHGETLGLASHVATQLTMNTLQLPALRERGPKSLMSHVLARLGPRPLGPGVWRLLGEHPWWGNLRELDAKMRLLSQGHGRLEVEELRALLPELLGADDGEPMVLMQSPLKTPDGGYSGASWRIETRAALIGRVHAPAELEVAAATGDGRARRWAEEVERQTSGSLTCVPFDLLRRLSRAHVLITRGPQGLEVCNLPGTGLGVRAGGLREALRDVAPGETLMSGAEAIEVRVCHEHEPYLQLFAFSQEEARAAHIDHAIERVRAMRRGVLETQDSRGKTTTARIWELAPHETDYIVDMVWGYRGGTFTRHIKRAMAPMEGVARYRRLHHYLSQAPRIPQYLLRLCEKPENAQVRRQLRERLHHQEEPEAALALLPTGLQRLILGEG